MEEGTNAARDLFPVEVDQRGDHGGEDHLEHQLQESPRTADQPAGCHPQGRLQSLPHGGGVECGNCRPLGGRAVADEGDRLQPGGCGRQAVRRDVARQVGGVTGMLDDGADHHQERNEESHGQDQ
jgi:hypothetical protein